ncbi:hypothetical protein [Streptomyces mangrovisoli]|uniref:ABC transporter permease n=1 Tax=Streptomyces mangrovisoli TaxID=1428628 RepID=A0A1J4NQT5_9ACTN|nr:hypothetical protein [Streptomyces mangrovisoli]OIJ64801.1 ABC transporter permease [Streptomyces mangrovisoli]
MSTTVLRPAGPVAAAARAAYPVAAVLALARFEARELSRQISVAAYLLLYTGYTAYVLIARGGGMADFPVLQDADRNTQTAPLLLAIALLACVNRAALRSRRCGTDEQFGGLVVRPWQRTVAHALSAAPYAVYTALVVAVRFGRQAVEPGAVGHGSLAELAVGPLSVLLAGALGVLLARLVPYSMASLLFVATAYVLAIYLSATTDLPHGVRWLSPVVSEPGETPVPSALLGRPAGWHALYLAGLCVLLPGIAVLVDGGRTRAVKTATVLALLATAAGAIGQAPGGAGALRAARARATDRPAALQTCVAHAGSAYCAFPEWAGQTDDWAAVVDRVRSAAGGTAATTALTVRQRVDARGHGDGTDIALAPSTTPGEVTVGTRWGGDRVPEFAAGVAGVLVAGREDAAGELCGARAVTAVWLAVGTDPHPWAAYRALRPAEDDVEAASVDTPTEPLTLSAAQSEVLAQLLRRPAATVAARVRAHWNELTAPRTTTAEVAHLLAVPPLRGTDNCDP